SSFARGKIKTKGHAAMTIERYKVIQGIQIIEVRVNDVQQLFDYRDPAPFRIRDLDENFSRYLESYLDEISPGQPIKLKIYITKPSEQPSSGELRESIHGFFEYRIQTKRAELSKNRRMAEIFLGIGLAITCLCLALAQGLRYVEPGIIGTTVREGIVIFGWVALWRPLELLLFEWYPIYDRIRIYRRLVSAEIEIILGMEKGI
ncbi:MAG: hypothetical protein J7501_12330, partial [Bdellovibrio sp.]|nr:hypothetical protein [Bdellovibrio sp.]